MEQNETKIRNYRKTRIGIVVSDSMDKTRVVAIQNNVRHPIGKIVKKINAKGDAA